MRATLSCLGLLSVVLPAGPMFPLPHRGPPRSPPGVTGARSRWATEASPVRSGGAHRRSRACSRAPGRRAGRHDVSPDASRPAR